MLRSLIQWLGHPRTWIPGLIVAVVLIILLSVGGAGYFYVEHNPRFCVSCHTMEGPFQKWQEGTHAMVNCHECHKQSKLDSLHQVWMYITERPDTVVHHPSLDHKVCAQCHMNNEQHWHDIQETAGHKVHFERGGIECLDCHGNGIHAIEKPEGLCITCHTDKTEMHNKMNFVACTQCHNFLTKNKGAEGIFPTRQNCLNCHEKMKPLSPKNHPAAAQQNCSSCHKPHS